MHNLLNSLFDLRHYRRFETVLKAFSAFGMCEVANFNDNNHIQTFVYPDTARIKHHFMAGSFKDGGSFVPELEEKPVLHSLHLKRHRVLVFCYKATASFLVKKEVCNAGFLPCFSASKTRRNAGS